jgi:hypothetical protein
MSSSNSIHPPGLHHVLDKKCQYKTGKCLKERTLKRNGEYHSLCEEHRIKQNIIQRRSDRKYQIVHAIRRKERNQRKVMLKKHVQLVHANQKLYVHQEATRMPMFPTNVPVIKSPSLIIKPPKIPSMSGILFASPIAAKRLPGIGVLPLPGLADLGQHKIKQIPVMTWKQFMMIHHKEEQNHLQPEFYTVNSFPVLPRLSAATISNEALTEDDFQYLQSILSVP